MNRHWHGVANEAVISQRPPQRREDSDLAMRRGNSEVVAASVYLFSIFYF